MAWQAGFGVLMDTNFRIAVRNDRWFCTACIAQTIRRAAALQTSWSVLAVGVIVQAIL
jgi:hypothetical protein